MQGQQEAEVKALVLASASQVPVLVRYPPQRGLGLMSRHHTRQARQ